MMNDSKPVALVTGATSGIGKDIALRLLREGYTLYGASRRVDRMADILDQGGQALPLDLTQDASITLTVEQLLHDETRIDVLVNSAGYGQYGALEDVPIDEARRQMETNLFGLARLVQLCVPHMRKAGSGKIVNISSIGGTFATPLGGWYHASKFALEGYSDALRNELRQFGIDVVVIQPGGITSEWGAIAKAAAERYSRSGAYARMVDQFGRMQSANTPPPSVVSDLVVAAIKAKIPKARYSGGYMAKPLLFLKRWLSDKMFDRVIMSAFR